MAIDQVTAEVMDALDTQGIATILLKGPSIATWLYPDGGRYYGDTDLLVDPAQFVDASAVLMSLGFEKLVGGQSIHAHTFRRRGDDGWSPCIDLHRTIPLVAAPPAQLWRAFAQGTETLRVAGTEVTVLGIPQQVLHIALHSVQHAFESTGPIEDLRRALGMVDLGAWSAAASLSRELGAEDALAAGLRLIPEGAAVADALALTDDRRGIVRIAASPHSEAAAYYVQRVLDAGSLTEKVKLVADGIFPARAIMRQESALARRGRAGLALSYVLRPVVLVRRIGPALAIRRRILTPHE
jgi:hypothetical protein